MSTVDIDLEYLKEVMDRCRKENPEIADQDYLVWVNSVDYILREMGYNVGEEEGKRLYEKAHAEFQKTDYRFEVENIKNIEA